LKTETRDPKPTPLEYMLAVMNDNGADITRRDRMAIAAAPYVHGRTLELPSGKKAERKQAAENMAGIYTIPPPPKLPSVQ
jgi:hypothetical protein